MSQGGHTPQKQPLFRNLSSPRLGKSSPTRLLILFLGKHLPSLDLHQFEEEHSWGLGSTLQKKDFSSLHTQGFLSPSQLQ